MKAAKAAQVQSQPQAGAAPQVPGQTAPVQQPGYGQPYGYQVSQLFSPNVNCFKQLKKHRFFFYYLFFPFQAAAGYGYGAPGGPQPPQQPGQQPQYGYPGYGAYGGQPGGPDN